MCEWATFSCGVCLQFADFQSDTVNVCFCIGVLRIHFVQVACRSDCQHTICEAAEQFEQTHKNTFSEAGGASGQKVCEMFCSELPAYLCRLSVYMLCLLHVKVFIKQLSTYLSILCGSNIETWCLTCDIFFYYSGVLTLCFGKEGCAAGDWCNLWWLQKM